MHIHFQLKTSNDYEIYQLDDVSKSKLNDICDLRQPVVFNYSSDLLSNGRLSQLETKYHNLDFTYKRYYGF